MRQLFENINFRSRVFHRTLGFVHLTMSSQKTGVDCILSDCHWIQVMRILLCLLLLDRYLLYAHYSIIIKLNVVQKLIFNSFQVLYSTYLSQSINSKINRVIKSKSPQESNKIKFLRQGLKTQFHSSFAYS